MAGLADLLEAYKNYRGVQNWKLGQQMNRVPGAEEAMNLWGGWDTGGLAGVIKAYHGSPSAFTKFLMSKLGTGEGAQAYGHGLYFAQALEVALNYAKTLARQAGETGKIGKKSLSDFYTALENKANRLPPDKAALEYEKLAFLEDLEQQPSFQHALARIDDPEIEAWAKTLESQYQPAGHLYDVSLEWPSAAKEAATPLSEEHLLDWDAPYEMQPKSIQDLLAQTYRDVAKKRTGIRDRLQQKFAAQGKVAPIREEMSPITGQQLYDQIAAELNSRQLASNYLNQQGIPGIRYLDQVSRGAGEGTRNYVIFDENIPRIVSRNGVSLTDLLRK